MEWIKRVILIICLLIPMLQPLALTQIGKNSNKARVIGTVEEFEKQSQSTSGGAIDPKPEELDRKLRLSILDFEGYCTIGYSTDYFNIDSANSNNYIKDLIYRDNKARLTMSYVVGLSDETDITGYIVNKLAKEDTVTNNKYSETHGSNDWIFIKSDKQIDENDIYVIYTTNKAMTSAFWMKLKIRPETFDEGFKNILSQMLDSYTSYAPDGTMFKTPETGYYKKHKDDFDNSTIADGKTGGKYTAKNENKNQVFNTRGGYVKGAKISKKWDDLEIIVDGHKFRLPNKLKDYKKAKFSVNDSSYKDKTKIEPLNKAEFTIENDNGTVLKITAYNKDKKKKKMLKDCSIIKLVLDSKNLIDYNVTESGEAYNEATRKDKNASLNAKDEYNHELVLAKGVTWNAFTDDLKNMYSSKCKVENYSPETLSLIWTIGPRTMIVRTGLVRGIEYVELKALEID